jgi:hypothetical protein
LLLLVIALAAVCSAYLRTNLDLRRYDIERVRSDIETQIEVLESRRAHYATDPDLAADAAVNTRIINRELMHFQEKLAELEK